MGYPRPMPVSWSLVTVLLVAAGLLAAAYRVWGRQAPREPGRVLAPRELAFVAAVSDATYPEGGPVAPSGTGAGLPAYADLYTASVPPTTRRLMRALFFLVEHATLIFPAPGAGGRRRFSLLDTQQQVAVLEAWRTSSLFPRRLVFQSLRAILTMGYFADDEVQGTLGLVPREIQSPVVEADLLYPPIGRPKSEIRHRAVSAPEGARR